MRFLRLAPHLLAAATTLLLTSCGGAQDADDFGTRAMKMPNGESIRVEVLYTQTDLMKGMKYRDSLAPDRGMLFVHGKPGKFAYWMHEVKIPLDIVWLSQSKNVVQVVHEAPPCPGPMESCMSYGGHFEAMYVLELASGGAKKYGLRPGAAVDF